MGVSRLRSDSAKLIVSTVIEFGASRNVFKWLARLLNRYSETEREGVGLAAASRGDGVVQRAREPARERASV